MHFNKKSFTHLWYKVYYSNVQRFIFYYQNDNKTKWSAICQRVRVVMCIYDCGNLYLYSLTINHLQYIRISQATGKIDHMLCYNKVPQTGVTPIVFLVLLTITLSPPSLMYVGHLIATRLRIPHSKLPAVFAHLGKLYKIYIYPGQINMSTLTFIVILIV